jgi:hypothetical protein
MPFLMPCTNKGCGKTQAPYFNKKDEKVYCSECGNEIVNVSSFAKHQMKVLKQYKDDKKSFSVVCDKCKKSSRPVLNKDELYCGECNKILDVNPFFKNMLKEQLKNVDKDVD